MLIKIGTFPAICYPSILCSDKQFAVEYAFFGFIPQQFLQKIFHTLTYFQKMVSYPNQISSAPVCNILNDCSLSRLHVQIRLMGNFGFSAELPWASKADDALCFICKESNDNLYHFLFDCPYFRDNFDSLWSNLVIKATNCNSADGSHVSSFLTNLDQHNKALMLVGCLPLPFDSVTVTLLTRFVASAVGKIYKLRTERLRELEAPWLRKAVK